MHTPLSEALMSHVGAMEINWLIFLECFEEEECSLTAPAVQLIPAFVTVGSMKGCREVGRGPGRV